MERFITYITPLRVFVTLIVLTTLINTSFAQGVPTTTNTSSSAGNQYVDSKFSTKDLFPSWDDEAYRVQGIAGRNEGKVGEGENKLLLHIVPTIINIILTFVAPIVFVMMVLAGLRFIYAMDNEEEREKSKKFFIYTVVGLIFIMVSYSIMRGIYFIFVGN